MPAAEHSGLRSVAQALRLRHPVPKSVVQIGKMFAYFALLILGVRLLEEIFEEISRSPWAHELSRVSGLAASLLDVNKNIDDLIVTIFALTIAFLLILPVSWVHMITKGDEADPSLAQTLIVLSVIVAGVMLMLADNLARAFSLVGVVAAVRYRNTLRDPKDAVYVFLSLGIGMACGFQSYHVALILSLFECGILLVLWLYQSGNPLPLSRQEDDDERERGDGEADDEARPKKANAVITVLTTGSEAANNSVSAIMEEQRGNWRLIRAEETDGVTTLEYLGRQSRKAPPPVNLLDRLRKVDPAVTSVSFQSLRASDATLQESPSAG